MFLWAGSKVAEGRSDQRYINQHWVFSWSISLAIMKVILTLIHIINSYQPHMTAIDKNNITDDCKCSCKIYIVAVEEKLTLVSLGKKSNNKL